jgi:hypothetical protein
MVFQPKAPGGTREDTARATVEVPTSNSKEDVEASYDLGNALASHM